MSRSPSLDRTLHPVVLSQFPKSTYSRHPHPRWRVCLAGDYECMIHSHNINLSTVLHSSVNLIANKICYTIINFSFPNMNLELKRGAGASDPSFIMAFICRPTLWLDYLATAPPSRRNWAISFWSDVL